MYNAQYRSSECTCGDISLNLHFILVIHKYELVSIQVSQTAWGSGRKDLNVEWLIFHVVPPILTSPDLFSFKSWKYDKTIQKHHDIFTVIFTQMFITGESIKAIIWQLSNDIKCKLRCVILRYQAIVAWCMLHSCQYNDKVFKCQASLQLLGHTHRNSWQLHSQMFQQAWIEKRGRHENLPTNDLLVVRDMVIGLHVAGS